MSSWVISVPSKLTAFTDIIEGGSFGENSCASPIVLPPHAVIKNKIADAHRDERYRSAIFVREVCVKELPDIFGV